MMNELLNGTAVSTLLIEDSLQHSGIELLKTFMTSLADNVDLVQLLLYEQSEDNFIRGLQPHVTEKLRVTNFTVDPLGWNDSESSVTVTADPCRHLAASWRPLAAGRRVAVVVDSLFPLILARSPAYTCQTLRRLHRNAFAPNVSVEHVVALVHADLHDDTTLAQLRHTVATTIAVSPSQSGEHATRCHLLHKKISGKVIKQRTEISISKSYQVAAVVDVTNTTASPMATGDANTVHPADNLTFNLTLSTKEQEDRSRLVLPYIHTGERQQNIAGATPGATRGAAPGQGAIVYEADDADDYDDEDPDDDLDI